MKKTEGLISHGLDNQVELTDIKTNETVIKVDWNDGVAPFSSW